jgi:hypothetical protein
MAKSRRDSSGSDRCVKWLHLAQQPGLAMLACLAAMLLFTWPLISKSLAWRIPGLFYFYFGLWALLILVIFIIALASRLDPSSSNREDD